MNKNDCLVRLTPEILESIIEKEKREQALFPKYHRASQDFTLGCPDLPSEMKILRYVKASQIYDNSSNPIDNKFFNSIMKASKKYLTEDEYTKFIEYLKRWKIGDIFRK